MLNLGSFHSDIVIVVGLIFGILTIATILFATLKKLNPEKDYSELIQRTKSWWVMATVFIAATLLNNTISYVGIAFLSFLAFRELYSILNFRNEDRRAIFWALCAIPVQFYLAYIGWYGAFIIFIPIVMFLLLPMRMLVVGNMSGFIKSTATLQWSLMLTVYSLSHMAYLLSLPEVDGVVVDGRALLLFVVFLTEINDVLQFTWGKLFGKHKVVPKISPNKTWEGLIGGILCTIIFGYFLRFLTPLSPVEVVLVSLIIALAGFVGDIVMSAIKRDIGIKDTGSTIPGHGGVLDRIDSLSYTAPVFFHLIFYILY